MTIVNRDYFKLVLLYIAQYCGDSDNGIRVSKPHRAKEQKCASVFGPHNVKCALPCQMWGVDLPSIVGGGVRRPCTTKRHL